MTSDHFGFNADYPQQEPTPEQVRSLPGTTLLEFGAPWCGHCQGAQPALRTALATVASLRHIKVHDGKGKPLGRAFGIKLWPSLILLRDGEELARLVRPNSSADIESFLHQV